MSNDLSYSVELAAERSSERYYLEKRFQKHGLSYGPLENRLKKLGIKHFPSDMLVDSLASLKHDAHSILDVLIESGYKYYNKYESVDDSYLSSALHLLDAERNTPSSYINVFRKLKEKMGYKTVDVADQIYQVDIVYKMSRFGGSDVCKIIDILAEVGYKLGDLYGKKWLHHYDVDLVNKLAKLDIDEFLKAFRKLKEKFKYKSVGSNSLGQINEILTISQILGYSNTIDSLARTGYKIKNMNITRRDVEEIKYASDRLLKDSLECFIPCLYKSSPVEFIEYFKGLGVEDKKVVIKSILNCNETFNDHGVVTWLDENYPELVREVGLSLV